MQAEAKANLARAEAVKSEQLVVTVEEVAKAECEKRIVLVAAAQDAEKQAIGVTVAAAAEKEASEARASAIRTIAAANRENYEVEAAGKRRLNEAVNTLSEAQISLQAKLALIGALPQIIEEAVKPMQQIDSIKIVQVEGLNSAGGGASGSGNTIAAAGAGGNLAEQAVNAALKYRACSPVVDSPIVGLSNAALAGLVAAQGGVAEVNSTETIADPAVESVANPDKAG